ncbi:MAG: DUF418 domain-containing protein [Actinomycetota bacterium]
MPGSGWATSSSSTRCARRSSCSCAGCRPVSWPRRGSCSPWPWALQLWWSTAWLQRYRYGPFEWAWRSATYRSRQQLRRPRTANT